MVRKKLSRMRRRSVAYAEESTNLRPRGGRNLIKLFDRGRGHGLPFPRHEMPELCIWPVPRKEEGAGKAGCYDRTRSLVCERQVQKAHELYRYAETCRPSLRNGFTAYSALSPEYRYLIHTFFSARVVPYLMWRKSSRPIRITFGPGFP